MVFGSKFISDPIPNRNGRINWKRFNSIIDLYANLRNFHGFITKLSNAEKMYSDRRFSRIEIRSHFDFLLIHEKCEVSSSFVISIQSINENTGKWLQKRSFAPYPILFWIYSHSVSGVTLSYIFNSWKSGKNKREREDFRLLQFIYFSCDQT